MLQLTFLLLSLWTPLEAQKAPYDCGNLGQKACGYRDFEYYNIGWGLNKCEKDLEERDGICVNKNRLVRPRDAGWIAWATREQLYSISATQPINRIPWYSAHNAFSSRRQGFPGDLYANQVLSITDQLNAGARHIEIDPHFYTYAPPPVDPAVRLCHASSTYYCLATGYGNRLFGFLLAEVRAWLRANPDEVLIVKLNEKNIGSLVSIGYNYMYQELEDYLGAYAYRPNGAFTRWPTVAEIRAAGKQVVLMQHDTNVPSSGENLVWDAHTYIQSNNWPKNQNFTDCISQDGVLHANRGAKEWWDVAEGRSLSNGDLISEQTGLLTEGTLRRAVNCGAAILGVDFIQALNSAPIGNRPNNHDARLYSTIWSWAENDFGVAGPAFLNPTTRRWHSAAAGTLKPFACARKRSLGDPNDVRDWRITSATGAWNLSFGNAMCAAEFGVDFEFAHPRNGFQNRQLADLAYNSPNGVWLRYSTEPRGFVAASTSEVFFTAAPGATSIAPQTIQFYGIAGAQATTESTVPWLQVQPTSTRMPDNSTLPVTITPVGQVVSTLAPGVYKTNVVLRSLINISRGEAITFPLNIEVTLTIRKPVSFTVAPEQNPVNHNIRARVIATLPQLTPKLTGTLSFVRTSAPDPATTVMNVDAFSGQYVDFNGLPAGKHRFGVSYSGDNYYLPADSNEIEIEVLPRIRVTPNAVTFSMDFGGAVPPGQSLAIAGASTGLTATRPCGWLNVSVPNASQISLSLVAAQVQPLAPGAYDCPVTLSDSLSATQGSTVVPVVLNVRTTLSASPTLWDITTANDAVAKEFFVTTPGNRVAPITAVANQPWISVTVPNGATPTNMIVTANPAGLAPGTHTARVTVTSPLAANTVFVDVTLRVVRETVVDTVPSGLRIVVDGAPLTAPAKFVWTPGTVHQITTDTFQEQPNGIRYRFLNWQHGGTQTQNVVATASGGVSYFAHFTPEYRLSTDVVPSAAGIVQRSPAGDGYYAPNTPVQLTAQPNPGKTFLNWSGNAAGTNPVTSVVMNAPKSAIANFADLAAINFAVQSPVATTIQVNGVSYAVPGNVPMVPGISYLITAPSEVPGITGVRWLFQSWQGLSATASFSYIAPTAPATLTLVYQQQFLVTVTSSPSTGGTVTGGSWVNAGAGVTLQATAASGFQFTGFSGGGLTAASGNPATIASITAPTSVVANFAATGTPNLFASTSGARTDGPAPGQRTVPLMIRNVGSGPAADAAITAITNITVTTGSGVVSAATAVPLNLGTIANGGQAATSLVWNWPATATRVQFTVRFTANGGAYNGSTTLTLFR